MPKSRLITYPGVGLVGSLGVTGSRQERKKGANVRLRRQRDWARDRRAA